MSKIINNIIGYKTFGGKIDITDPSYEGYVCWRINDISIVPGTYECSIKYDEDIRRVTTIGIYLNSAKDFDRTTMDRIGDIGVDVGMAGFFENKPDFNDEQWSEFCNILSAKEKAWLTDLGFWSESGYGDGRYAVYASIDENGNYDALEIEFINED